MTLPGVLSPNARPQANGHSSTPPPVEMRDKWYDMSEETSHCIGFVWNDGARQFIAPYSSLSEIRRDDRAVMMRFGVFEIRLQFSKDFPLVEMLRALCIHRVLTIHALPNEVAFTIVKIHPETGEETPV